MFVHLHNIIMTLPPVILTVYLINKRLVFVDVFGLKYRCCVDEHHRSPLWFSYLSLSFRGTGWMSRGAPFLPLSRYQTVLFKRCSHCLTKAPDISCSARQTDCFTIVLHSIIQNAVRCSKVLPSVLFQEI